MSDEIRRNSGSNNRLTTIKFRQIKIDSRYYCHRTEASLKPDAVKKLTENLISEGQATPLTVYKLGKPDPDGNDLYGLAGGFRRYAGIEEAIRKQLDVDRFHPDMEVSVVVVERGPDQTKRDFEQDLLVRSVAENEQRKSFEVREKLQIVKEFRDAGVADPRAASALSMSDSQYARFVAIVKYASMRQLVEQNCLGTTDAAELIKAAEKHNRMKEVERDLKAWVSEQRWKIERERLAKEKVGKKLTDSAAQVKRFVNRDLIQHWLKLIEQGKDFDQNVRFCFGILIDEKAGTITVPRSDLKVAELSADDLEMLVAELQASVDKVLPMMKERRVVEGARNMTEQERREELARIAEGRRRRQQEEEEANAGRPAEDFGVVPRPELADVDVDDEEATDLGSQSAVEENAERVAEDLDQIEEEAEVDTGFGPAERDAEGATSAAEHDDENEDDEEVSSS